MRCSHPCTVCPLSRSHQSLSDANGCKCVECISVIPGQVHERELKEDGEKMRHYCGSSSVQLLYSFPLADVDECAVNPCENGGTCSQGPPGTFECTCPVGFAGLQCETDINECLALSPCQNEGTCQQGPPGQYICICPPGFTGTPLPGVSVAECI